MFHSTTRDKVAEPDKCWTLVSMPVSSTWYKGGYLLSVFKKKIVIGQRNFFSFCFD